MMVVPFGSQEVMLPQIVLQVEGMRSRRSWTPDLRRQLVDYRKKKVIATQIPLKYEQARKKKGITKMFIYFLSASSALFYIFFVNRRNMCLQTRLGISSMRTE